MAWVAIVDPDTRIVRPVASFGDGSGEYLQDIKILADTDNPFGRGPTGTAIRENRPVWCQDFPNDPSTAPWHERGARFGWGSSTSLPLHRNGTVIGSFSIYSNETNAFNEAARDLLLEMASDISYALNNFAREARRKQAELRLLEHELQYRTLADSSPALIWTSGTDKLCDYFNKVWLEFTGRSLEQELGNGWAEGVHPDDFQHCLDVYVSAFDRREPFSMTYRLRCHDGAYRWIQDDGCPRYNTEGEFIGYIGYCLDITERKTTEDAVARYAHDMGERVKEIACLRDITLLSKNNELDVERILDGCVRRMPVGWLEPSRTCARIRFNDRTFETPNFHETEWKLAAEIPFATEN